jgi:hypothetical protein
MPREITDPNIIAALEGGQGAINRAAMPAGGAPQPGMFAGKAASLARNKLKAADNLERQLKQLQGYYNQDFKGVGPGSLLEYLPTQRAGRFNKAANSIRPSLKPLVRDPGEGTFTDADQALLDGLIPQSRNTDAENEQQFKDLQAMVANTRSQYAPPAAAAGFKIIARRPK